jgi:hypothetical protein
MNYRASSAWPDRMLTVGTSFALRVDNGQGSQSRAGLRIALAMNRFINP